MLMVCINRIDAIKDHVLNGKSRTNHTTDSFDKTRTSYPAENIY